jgi:hypothetical protein
VAKISRPQKSKGPASVEDKLLQQALDHFPEVVKEQEREFREKQIRQKPVSLDPKRVEKKMRLASDLFELALGAT